MDPIGRSTLDADGVVDLDLMPAFNDIARLTSYASQWWLYEASGGSTRDAVPVPLSKESLRGILESMKK